MKKCTTIVLSLLLCLVMILSACGEVNTVASIAFPADLKTTYEVGEKLEAFDITVTMKDGTTATIKSTDAELKITGFDTSKVASGKLVATYKGATVEANYTVVAKVVVTEVTNGDQLGSTGGNYKLAKDISLTSPWEINNVSIVLDLNGFELSASGRVINVKNGATLEINDSSAAKNGKITTKIDNNYPISIVGGTTEKAIYSKVTLNAGTVTGMGWGICVWYNGVTLTVNGGKIQTTSPTGYAISGNGSTGNGGTIININGGEIVGGTGYEDRDGDSLGSRDCGAGVYHPQAGTLNITGGKITGYDGLSIKSGSINISGGEIISSGDNYIPTAPYTSGGEATGSAITLISNKAYYGNMNVTISGGTITSQKGNAIAEYMTNAAATGTAVTKLEITGGTFNAASGFCKLKITSAQDKTTVSVAGLEINK